MQFELFWLFLLAISLLGIGFSYLGFPVFLLLLAKGKQINQTVYNTEDEDLPKVTIILAVYNELKVIEEKLLTTFHTNYPIDKIEFLIGSDASTDGTDEIIKAYQNKYPQIILERFQGRTGKAGICNQLSRRASNPIFILTDANVFFHPDTIYHLVKHYKNNEIALVGGNILNEIVKKDGISQQESTYLSIENKIKYYEGILWGTMIGAFGGVYSIRKTHYIEVPKKYFMDDFFITMNALSLGGKCINELEAKADEDVSNKISEEFRRKIRISIGNFQNLSSYWKLLFPLYKPLGFCFFSHKVLRWFGPFFLLFAWISCFSLIFAQPQFANLWKFCFLAQSILMFFIPLLDAMLKRISAHIAIFRFFTHFYGMNLALLLGFFNFIKGVESNIWKPTERNQ